MKRIVLTLGLLIAGNLQADAIHRAARLGNAALVQGQLNKGVSPDARDEHGNTPLHLARNTRTATLLVEDGAKVNAVNNYNVTPLHLVPLKRSLWARVTVGLGELLLANGADVHARDLAGNTPLHDAARAGQVRLMRKLIAHGAKVDAKNETGITPLHAAVGLIQRVPGALPRTAALGITSTGAAAGVTYYFAPRAAPIAAARAGTKASVAKMAQFMALSPEFTYLQPQLVARETKQSAQAASKAAYGTGGVLPTIVVTAAVIAAVVATIVAVKVIQRRLAVKTLLDAGAKVNAVDNLKNNALHFMAAGRAIKGRTTAHIAQMLIAAGADYNAENNAGYTPYQIARKYNRFGLLPVLNPKYATRRQKRREWTQEKLSR